MHLLQFASPDELVMDQVMQHPMETSPDDYDTGAV